MTKIALRAIVFAMLLPTLTAADEYYIARYATAVVPHRVQTMPLTPGTYIKICHSGNGIIPKGTLLAKINAEDLALAEEEMRHQQRKNNINAEEALLKLRRQKEELEFIMAQPNERRKFMEARFNTQADRRALDLLNEQIALQEEATRIANTKLQKSFDKEKASHEIKMPFDGKVQFHITPPANKEEHFLATQSGLLLSAVDDSHLFMAISPEESSVVNIPAEQLQLKLVDNSGKGIKAEWHHRKIENKGRSEKLIYYFVIGEADKEKAWSLMGANLVAELHYKPAEGENLQNVHKAELAAEAGNTTYETWAELVAALRPGFEILFIGETHICLRKID